MSQSEAPANNLFNARNISIAVLVTVAVFLLLTEHRSHFLNILPYVLLLACPFMHFFMHGHHGKHGNDGENHR